MTYTVSTKKYVGNKATIVERDDRGHEIPVMHLTGGETDFPGDIEKLAANLASILNGNPPLHQIDMGGNRVFWSRNEHGIALRLEGGA